MGSRETYGSDRIRNVALVGHRSSGKTTLAEALLAAAGVVRAAGRVDDGTALLDHDPEERRRHLSLRTAFAWLEWGSGLVQIADAPGSGALAYERSLALAAADVAVVVVDASEHLSVGAEQALREATRARLPTFVFVNKTDRPHDVDRALAQLRSAVDGVRIVPIEAPLGDSGRSTGVVDLRTGEADMMPGETAPDGLRAWMTRFAEQLAEAVALTDDELLEYYLENLELPDEMLGRGLSSAVASGRVVPVLFGSAASGFGARRLLDAVVALAPAASQRSGPLAMEMDGTPVHLEVTGDLVAQLVTTRRDEEGALYHVLRIWRGTAAPNQVWVNGETGASARVRKLYKLRGPRRATAGTLDAGAMVATWDPLPGRPGATFCMGERVVIPPPERPPSMMAFALRPRTDRDRRELHAALVALCESDAALDVHTDETTGQLLLRGFSDEHLQLALERLAGEHGVNVDADLPPIPYRETPVGPVHAVPGVHRREDGDGLPVEFGACEVDVEPRPPESGLRFEDAYPDREELPSKFRPAIDEGVRSALQHGPMAGYPVLGAQVRLVGGEYDILQSTEDHFRLAGEIAGRAALQRAGTRLLEPWWQVDVYARGPELGDVIGEISARRGRIVGMEVLGQETRLLAQMPFRELRTFGPRLQAATHGRGRFYGDFLHYELAPAHVVGEAIAGSPFRRAS